MGGSYYLKAEKGGHLLKLPGNPEEEVGKWTNWRFDFKLATSGGYIKVYRDDILIGSLEGYTSGAGSSAFKHGIYSINPPGSMSTYTKNMIIKETK